MQATDLMVGDRWVAVKDRILYNLNHYEWVANELPNCEKQTGDAKLGVTMVLAFLDYAEPIWPRDYAYKAIEILNRIKANNYFWAIPEIATHVSLLLFTYGEKA